MPTTIKARIILGWLSQEDALGHLAKCVFQPALTEEQKIALWNAAREKVAALPAIPYEPPARLKLSLLEKSNISKFLKSQKKTPSGRKHVDKVLKLDPTRLAIHQFMVVTDRSKEHGNQMKEHKARIRRCLGIGLDEGHKVTQRTEGNKTIVSLPHFEFELKSRTGGFDVNEMPRYISVVESGGRLVLWGGYHRTYALLSQMTPDAAGATAPLVTLIKDVPDADRLFALPSSRPAVREAIFAARPAFFGDFFDPDLFIEVDLLKQRREFHIEPTSATTLQGSDFWADE